jgi:hypothetical protein
MGAEDSLGIAGRVRQVAETGRLAGSEIRVVEAVFVAGEQVLVAHGTGPGRRRAIAHQDEAPNGGELGRDLIERPDEGVVHEQDLVLRVVDDVDQLFRREADVNDVEHGSRARNRHVELKMALRVTGERADAVALLDAQLRQGARQPVDALGDLRVRGARGALGGDAHHLAVARTAPHPIQEVLHRDGVNVLHQSFEHASGPLLTIAVRALAAATPLTLQRGRGGR